VRQTVDDAQAAVTQVTSGKVDTVNQTVSAGSAEVTTTTAAVGG
jgi:hypothetical protein